MILEYQHEQQNLPSYTDSAGNLLKYFPSSSRFDAGAYQHYVPKDDANLGRPAIVDDIRAEEQNIGNFINDFIDTENKIKSLFNDIHLEK